MIFAGMVKIHKERIIMTIKVTKEQFEEIMRYEDDGGSIVDVIYEIIDEGTGKEKNEED
jgi:hypothetical protein